MNNIQSTLITGLSATDFTERRALKLLNAPPGAKIIHMIFETILDSKRYYSCWVDGIVEDGKVRMTVFGEAALEALMAVPWGGKKILIYQDVIVGPTPLREKIIETFRKIPTSARVCFVGDLSGELNGLWDKALHVRGLTDISCLDMPEGRNGA